MTILGERAQGSSVRRRGRTVRVGAYPMGIDAAYVGETRPQYTGGEAGVRADAGRRQAQDSARHRPSRLHEGPAAPHRRDRALFQNDPTLAERARFIQVTFPSRERIESYAGLRGSSARCRKDQRDYGSPRSLPIHLMTALVLGGRGLVALQRGRHHARDAVSRRHEPRLEGVRRLPAARRRRAHPSEFAGAADEMPDALIVNPYDTEGICLAIRQAIDMPPSEQRERMTKLREGVMRNDVHNWGETFLADLEGEAVVSR